MTYQELANHITEIKYAELGKISFRINGNTILIKEPREVCLVGFPGSALWIAKQYSILLTAFLP